MDLQMLLMMIKCFELSLYCLNVEVLMSKKNF
jgi:hypothetical protein